MAILNLRDGLLALSSLDEITVLATNLLDLTTVVEQLPITDLSDVTIAAVQDGELLVYNGGTGEWENGNTVGQLIVENNITLDGKFFKEEALTPGFAQYGGAHPRNFCAFNFTSNAAPINIWKRNTFLAPQTSGYIGGYYDVQNTNANAWRGLGAYFSLPIADQVSIYNLGAFRTRTSTTAPIGVDGSGNLDHFVGEFAIDTYNKSSGNPAPVPYQPFATGTYGTTFISIDRVHGDPKAVQLYTNDNYTNLWSETTQGFKVLSAITFEDDIDCSNLPTTDPLVAGRLWNDNGTMKISAG